MILKVVPLRRERGWRLTDLHRAEAWAVAQFRPGHRMQILLRCDTKAKADAQLEGCQRAYEGLRSNYKLGQRMGRKEERNA